MTFDEASDWHGKLQASDISDVSISGPVDTRDEGGFRLTVFGAIQINEDGIPERRIQYLSDATQAQRFLELHGNKKRWYE